ncbi:hypothetical protein LTR84_008083 [Exophiala bonariae]|uniref:Uncharacterized protein n=1 Tax=Exophiala bonariae TaxID=1690606 RepID=A0AAV9NM00_9EURO|nr:hypothetical protein LTR84_008083 [Exophiala bonariae]
MIALAAACNSSISAVDRTRVLLLKKNLSIREFSVEPATSDTALILCRLLTCISQCTEDWGTAAMHMKNGRKILKEACLNRPYQTDLIRLMAPTLLGISSDASEDSEIVGQMKYDKRQSFTSLVFIRKQYGQLLTSLHKADWPFVDTDTNALLLLGWSTVTKASNSMAFPEIFNVASDDPLIPAAQVRAALLTEGRLLSLDQLVALCLRLFRHGSDIFVDCTSRDWNILGDWKSDFRLVVDNYVAHAIDVEPRTIAGTFWHSERFYSHCTVERHFREMGESSDDVDYNNQASDFNPSNGSVNESVDDRKGYYLEHVCPYRSGFTPAWYS